MGQKQMPVSKGLELLYLFIFAKYLFIFCQDIYHMERTFTIWKGHLPYRKDIYHMEMTFTIWKGWVTHDCVAAKIYIHVVPKKDF